MDLEHLPKCSPLFQSKIVLDVLITKEEKKKKRPSREVLLLAFVQEVRQEHPKGSLCLRNVWTYKFTIPAACSPNGFQCHHSPKRKGKKHLTLSYFCMPYWKKTLVFSSDNLWAALRQGQKSRLGCFFFFFHKMNRAPEKSVVFIGDWTL